MRSCAVMKLSWLGFGVCLFTSVGDQPEAYQWPLAAALSDQKIADPVAYSEEVSVQQLRITYVG